LVTFENSPSNVAAADLPLFHFILIDAVVSASPRPAPRRLRRGSTRQRLEGSTYFCQNKIQANFAVNSIAYCRKIRRRIDTCEFQFSCVFDSEVIC
jgi:hypothetical protein